MTAKHKFTATFSTGEIITRSSHNPYTHAYYVECDRADSPMRYSISGFSSSRSNAEKAARMSLNQLTGRRDFNEVCNPRGSRPSTWRNWANKTIRDLGGKAAWEQLIIAREQGAMLEIVEVTQIK
jgi:tRNA U38,U39,U40 pseudouridine synthase TruA